MVKGIPPSAITTNLLYPTMDTMLGSKAIPPTLFSHLSEMRPKKGSMSTGIAIGMRNEELLR